MNAILDSAEKQVEAKLTPDNRADYLKTVNAGMKVALKDGPNGILASLKNSKNPLHDCAAAAVNGAILLRRRSRDTMPIKAMVPAAMTMMLEALDFAERIGILKVDNAALVKATHIFADLMLKKAGITGKMLQTAASKVHQLTQDPNAVEKMKHAAGANASASAPMPEGAV